MKAVVDKMKNISYRLAESDDMNSIAKLALNMWESHSVYELAEEFEEHLASGGVIFLALDNKVIGFAQCGLRHDYVEGTDSCPVGYLEGIFVEEEYRKNGVARSLLLLCQNWAREKGCREFASDCELTNSESLGFHLNMGFEEVNRIICFVKKL